MPPPPTNATLDEAEGTLMPFRCSGCTGSDRDVAAAVVRAYLDALDPAEIAVNVGWDTPRADATRELLQKVRP